MKRTVTILATLFFLLFHFCTTTAQDLEITGKAKIGTMDKVNTADSVVVMLSDSTLAVRDVSTLTEMQILTISNDTIFLSDGQFVKLPADQVDDADADPTNELQSWTNLPGIPADFADDVDNVDDADADATNEKITGFGIIGDSLFIKEGSMDTMKVAISSSSCNLSLGQFYQGGYIFYLDGSGCHGMVADTSDLTGLYTWSTTNFSTYAFASGIYGGLQNTIKISGTTGTAPAADGCATSNAQGLDDWYLPSKDELDMMYVFLHLTNLGGFRDSDYWSSTEDNRDNAWWQSFTEGGQLFATKGGLNYVRCVRVF